MEKEKRLNIELYSDGASEPTNPGPSGYGIILRCPELNYQKEFSQGFEISTNNRMELMGVIVGLEQIKKPSNVTVYSDSKYVIEPIELGWFLRWEENNWMRSKKDKIANSDLWKRLGMMLKKHNVVFEWIKGHNGHPENERCDFLAVEACNSLPKIVDEGYNPNECLHYIVKKEGDLCYHCSIPVVKFEKYRNKKPKGTYYFEWYLKCPNCKAVYMVEEAKRLSSEWKDTNQSSPKLFEL